MPHVNMSKITNQISNSFMQMILKTYRYEKYIKHQNGDGRLSVEEIHGIYLAHGVHVTREEVQKIVDAADKDGTGLLTEKEFVNSQAVGDVSDFFQN